MKYDIIQKFITQNRSYIALQPKGCVVHETATPDASDENEQTYFNGAYRGASAHAFVDCDSITQCIPWNEKSWHAGQTANSSFIGIELCHYDDAAKFNEVWDRAVWLFAYVYFNILKIDKITPDNLMSHAEVSMRWHETDHMDPVDYFKRFGKSVDDFRVAVQNEIVNIKGNISYQAHVQNIGWMDRVSNGATAGTEGKALRMEALTVLYNGEGDLAVEGHVQNVGWQTLRGNGEIIGTVGMSLRLEAIKLRLENTSKHIEYQVHVENIGWMPWVRDGATAGTTGKSLRIEAIRIRIVEG